MKSSPILFSTEMVRAILDGRKTQTRRELKTHYEHFEATPVDFDKSDSLLEIELNTGERKWIDCPYGKIGDTLWVRETFCSWGNNIIYKANESKAQIDILKWKPSIFMPYAACRIFLEITNIRVEKLQSINNKDAQAEGASDALTVKDFDMLKGMDWVIPSPFLEYQFGFLALWSRINGVKSWLDNPYVWVIDFKIKEVKK
jgi:hypothetical protein